MKRVWIGALMSAILAGAVEADGLLGVYPVNFSLSTGTNLFPNWNQANVGRFTLGECDDDVCLTCPDGGIAAITVLNFGTASGGAGGDVAAMYFRVNCGKTDTGPVAMTYAGIYRHDDGDFPAWTWAGPPIMYAEDPCKACACLPVLNVYVDVAPCPAEGTTVRVGPGFNTLIPSASGGIMDACPVPQFTPPISVKHPDTYTIRYVIKSVNSDVIAPGDTLDYLIHYGLPGADPISQVVVTDSLPPYTHYVGGSAVPAPDPTWDPKPGPPQRLRWSIPGPFNPAGGRTSAVSFKASVDWGNGEAFEPGSGDQAPPEGFRLSNSAHAFFEGASCAVPAATSPATRTVVRRFLMWMMGDNDLLFASSAGQDPDEMIYSIYIKNLSTHKTWWDVHVWDTVPPELKVWCTDCGLDDPFVGWTMTPTGAASYSPGAIAAGGSTLLTWKLDMPPNSTAQLRWKAQVEPGAPPEAMAVNMLCVRAMGRTGIVGGTGDSREPKKFSHLAKIILRTIYVSYTSWSGANPTNQGIFLTFYPLNRKTQFDLYGLEYQGSGGWQDFGGVSDSIGCLLGNCIGGFPGNPGNCPQAPISGGLSIAGCGPLRIPAKYHPDAYYLNLSIDLPIHFIYKIVSNSPVVWETLPYANSESSDSMTYAPSTTMSYAGMTHYVWRLDVDGTQLPGYGTELSLINTGKDPYGAYNPDLATSVHMFQYNYANYRWNYRKTYEIGPESQAYDPTTLAADEGPWMVLSSDTHLIINNGYNMSERLGCCCTACANNGSSYMPVRETGRVTSTSAGETFYGIVQSVGNTPTTIMIENAGPTPAQVKYFRYYPDSAAVLLPGVPPMLKGTSGSWLPVGGATVPSGPAAVGNPAIYNWDGPEFSTGGAALYKIELVSGGPIQIHAGKRVSNQWCGGAVMHAVEPAGSQAGTKFWFAQTWGDWTSCCCAASNYPVHTMDVFCPKTGFTINMKSPDGYNSTYTTTGPDQVVCFMRFTEPDLAEKRRNYEISVVNPEMGNVIALYNCCHAKEKGYTAPFLATGRHYEILAPAVAYLGQPFWITVVVTGAVGGTETDYCGTSAFTSSDPLAQIEGVPMALFNYDWTSEFNPECATGSDNGIKIFGGVILNELGIKNISVFDTTDGSVTGLAAIMVVGINLKFSKEPKMHVASSGDEVQFRICWSSYSSASALEFTVTDAIPKGTTYVQDLLANHLCGATDGLAGASVAFSTADNQPGSFQPLPAGGTSQDVKWLRWTIPQVGVDTTGCVCFKVRVD